jgi:hypothetical protein
MYMYISFSLPFFTTDIRKEHLCLVFLYLISLRHIQYSQGHTMINHCDRRITLLSDTDIFFGLFNLFTYFDMPFG